MVSHGVQAMSIGLLIDVDTPMVWRGPMVTQALEQLLRDTHWKDLDYLVVDLPPGTGDIQLTLAQKVPVTGAVIVTTPQDIALIDARKGLKMFEKVDVPILGIVENMSDPRLLQLRPRGAHLRRRAAASEMASDYGVDVAGLAAARHPASASRPTRASRPWSPNRTPLAQIYREIARKVAARIAEQPRTTAVFPKIVIQNTGDED